jgi:hypothetical protein
MLGPEMNTRLHYGCLFIAVLTAWAEDLAPATPRPSDVFVPSAEVYPIALRYRTEIQADLELSPSLPMHLPVPTFFQTTPHLLLPELQETIPQVFSSADICYVLMSLQR